MTKRNIGICVCRDGEKWGAHVDVGQLILSLLSGCRERVIYSFVLHSALFVVALYGIFTTVQPSSWWAGVVIGSAVLSILILGAGQGMLFKVERLSTRLGKVFARWEMRQDDVQRGVWREGNVPRHLRSDFPVLSHYVGLERDAAGVVGQVLSNVLYGIAKGVLVLRVMFVVLVVSVVVAPVALVYHNELTWDKVAILLSMFTCNMVALWHCRPGRLGWLGKVAGWPFRWTRAKGRLLLDGVEIAIYSQDNGATLTLNAVDLPAYSPGYLPQYGQPGKSSVLSEFRSTVHVFDVRE